MLIKNFSKKEYNKLKEFVPNTKFNTEGFLFLVPNKEFWSKGIATEATSLIINFLFNQTDITMVSSSNMIGNPASGRVLEKNGFSKIEEGILEEWGFSQKVYADKWVLKKLK